MKAEAETDSVILAPQYPYVNRKEEVRVFSMLHIYMANIGLISLLP